ncbi:dnaJ homolog subfamily C member 7-like isoform X5 [Amblyomma americanum]
MALQESMDCDVQIIEEKSDPPPSRQNLALQPALSTTAPSICRSVRRCLAAGRRRKGDDDGRAAARGASRRSRTSLLTTAARPEPSNSRLAEVKREQGNDLYSQQKYDEAVRCYTEAIELDGCNVAYVNNRSACYMMLGNYRAALDDCRLALQKDPRNAKSLLREVKCHVAMGDLGSAKRSLQLIRELDAQGFAQARLHKTEIARLLKTVEILEHFLGEADKAYEAQDYEKVIYCMDRVLQHAVSCTRCEVLKAESLALLKKLTGAREIADNIMRAEPTNADAVYVRGLCFYYEDNIEKAIQHFQQVLRLAPDHPKASVAYKRARLLKSKKDEGNEAFNGGKYEEAFNIYTSALEVDPRNNLANSKLYFNRATVCSKLNKLNQTVEDCTTAISLNEDYVKAYMRRAKTYMDLEMYEEAVRDYECIFRKDQTRENKRLLDQAKLALKKSKCKDYYKVLGIPKDATVDDIKKAYRKRALLHHPDRHSNASEDMKREQEKKFKELGEAYNILSDPKKRMRYDEGRDLDEMEGCSSDPNPHVFRTFFFETPGFSFSTNANSFQHNSGFGGFPGGFNFQFR